MTPPLRLHVFLAAIVAGVSLRAYDLSGQIIADDEWHALHALMNNTYGWLFTHFGNADYCIPLTLFYRVCFDVHGLSEWIMRLPVLAAGVVALIVLPTAVKKRIGNEPSQVLAWLVAISPLLVYFSRNARPYSLVVLLSGLGAIAFYEWWTSRDPRWGAGYVACASLGPYFHLTSIAFLGAPLLFGLVEKVAGKTRDVPGWRPLMLIGVCVALGWALLLGPPLICDSQAMTSKAGLQRVALSTVDNTWRLLVGSPSLVLALVTTLAGLWGGFVLYKRQKRWTVYIITLVLLQLAFIVLASADVVNVPIVFARYNLSCLPFLLILVAVGTWDWGCQLQSRLRVMRPWLVPVMLIGCLFWFGPIRSLFYTPNNWRHHALFQYMYDPLDREFSYVFSTCPTRIPEFYRELSKQTAGSLLLLEAPWYYEWHNNPFPFYQHTHRQRMMVGFVDSQEPLARPGEYPAGLRKMRFRNYVHLSDREKIAAAGVNLVVFHKDLSAEFPMTTERASVDIDYWIEVYREWCGKPVYDDELITVFSVKGRSE